MADPSKRPDKNDPRRIESDFREMVRATEIMSSPYYGYHRGGLMKGDNDPDRKVSPEHLPDERIEQLLEAFQPVVAMAQFGPPPAPSGDGEYPDAGISFGDTLATGDLQPPIAAEPEQFATSPTDAAELFEPPETPSAELDPGEAFEPAEALVDSTIEPQEPAFEPFDAFAAGELPPADLPPMEPQRVLMPEAPIDVTESIRLTSGRTVLPEQPFPPPKKKPEPKPEAESRIHPFLRGGGPVEHMPPIALPEPEPSVESSGSVVIGSPFTEPVTLRDPVGKLVDTKFTATERQGLEDWRQADYAISNYGINQMDWARIITSTINRLAEEYRYLRDSLISEGSDTKL